MEATTTTAKYIAVKLTQDIRSGFIPSKELSREVNRFPLIDLLRERIEPADLPNLKSLCESQDIYISRLGFSLLRKIHEVNEVRAFVESQWPREDLPFDVRVTLQFMLLSYAELGESMHEELLRFTLSSWDQWLADAVNWSNGQHSVIDYCQERLSSPNLPESKRWVYICCAAASGDQAKTRALISNYVNDPDPFLVKVADEVLDRLDIN